MTSKLVVNTIESDTGISSVSFASSISMSSTSKFHFSAAGIDIGADTNINRPLAGVLGFNINGSQKVVITSNGRLGIGTENPASDTNLHILDQTDRCRVVLQSGGNESSQLWLQNPKRTWKIHNYYDQDALIFLDDSDERLRINADGKVGLGTTGSDYALSIREADNNNKFLMLQKNSGQQLLQIREDGDNHIIIDGSHASGELHFYTAGDERLRINSTGRVGIGTNNPGFQLDVDYSGGEDGIRILNRGTSSGATSMLRLGNDENINAAYLMLNSSGYTSVGGAYNLVLGHGLNRDLVFATGGAEKVRITSGGNLGVGYSTPSQRFVVHAGADNSDIAVLTGGDVSRGLKISTSQNTHNDANIIYDAQDTYGQHIFKTGGTIVGRFEHDQSGFISENTASGDGDTEVGVALQNDYSSWGVIYKNDWIGNGSGWGTFWAGNSGARYRRVSSDGNPNEHVMVGSGNKRFTFDLDSGGNAYFDGSLSQNAYDYAEYFEWEDGNPSNEDRRGYSVFVNSNGKIEKATDSTNTAEIIGVISGTAAVVGDSAIYDWQGKWKVDEWGTLVTEVVKQVSWKDDEGKRHSYDLDKVPSGITIPSDASYRQHKRRILNTDYDDSKEYVPRDMRQEWDPVGLLGKVRVRDDSPKNPNWKFIRTINGKKLWLIR